MGNCLEQSILFIREKYPELSISKEDHYIEFDGRFYIDVKYKGWDIEIAPRLKILFPISYPLDFSIVFDVLNSYPSEHRLSNGGLCVATPFDLLVELNTSVSIKDYIEKFLIPYFISVYVYGQTGSMFLAIGFMALKDFINQLQNILE